jgi:hypothetical protein
MLVVRRCGSLARRGRGAAALDRESTPPKRMRLGEMERFAVAAAVGGHYCLEHDHTRPHLDNTNRVLIASGSTPTA